MIKLSIESFTLEENPCWECPTCHQKTLEIVKEAVHERYDSNSYKEVASEQAAYGRDPHPYQLSGGVFTALLRCVSSTCKEFVACSGTSTYDIEYGEDWANGRSDVHVTRFKPMMFVPPLQPFIIPEDCDKRITDPLLSSFSLLPSSPGSAANNLRITVERYLDVLGIPHHDKLHHRIDILEKSEPVKAHAIMSIKWMGNSGSHEYEKVSAADVMSGYVIFKRLLDELYPVEIVDNSKALADSLHAKYDAKYAQRSNKS